MPSPAFIVNLFYYLFDIKKYFLFIWSDQIYESMMDTGLVSMGKTRDTHGSKWI